jgi:hypothetical protein
MKMKTEHYNHIEETIKTTLKDKGFTIKMVIERCRVSGSPDKAIRWYLLNSCGLTPFVCKTLYTYLNDNHIDTALRRITNTK